MTRYRFRRPWGAIPALLIVVLTVMLWRPAAAVEPTYAPNGIAIKGADPVAYFVDGKLYLNYNKSVRLLWTARRSHYIREADKNWPQILAGS